jgi:hypothetical protein
MSATQIIYKGVLYHWSASQDSEHPGMIIERPDHEIYIQVIINEQDKTHNKRFAKGIEKYPISQSSAYKVIKAVVEQNYIETDKDSDVGLIFDEDFNLIET